MIYAVWQIQAQLKKHAQQLGSGGDGDTAGCVRGWSDLWQSPWRECPHGLTGQDTLRTVVWYDDANSTALTAALAKKLKLGGSDCSRLKWLGLLTARMRGKHGRLLKLSQTLVTDSNAVAE